MKFHLKRIVAIFGVVCVSLIFWNAFAYNNNKNNDNNNNNINNNNDYKKQNKHSSQLSQNSFLKYDVINDDEEQRTSDERQRNSLVYKKLLPIDCVINEEYSVGCMKSTQDDSVFIPFSFIKKYFEINGKVVKKKDGKEVFVWEHSYSRVFYPREKYDTKGTFLWFQNYNVEVRDRVKCISGIESVPISTQWEPKGHFYPVQIAQFGLSHFSKNLTRGKPRRTQLDLGHSYNKRIIDYNVPKYSFLHRITSDEDESNKIVSIDGTNIVLKMKRKPNNDLTLSFQLKPLANFSLTVILKGDANSVVEYSVTYMTIDDDIVVKDSQVIYGIGSSINKWKSIVRDVGIDLQKGLVIGDKKTPAKVRNIHLIRIEMNGKALIDDIVLSSSAHEFYAQAAADWFVANQDANGGWPIKVTRKLSNGALVLNPGWYSAMAQGQAISLLCRMFHATNNKDYMNAAAKAVRLFNVDSQQNGIRTKFLDEYVWFEEYPTSPSSFVLNGFIYSLFGLYDLKMTCETEDCLQAHHLYQEGINSLEKMLPLYDTGSGSLYDLRHFSLGSAPNLARWDYHTTHINQLLVLNSIDNNLLFQSTAKRWITYMKGKRAPHN